MTSTVKKIIKNWVDCCDKANPPKNLSYELKSERIHGIKTVIKFLNQLEKDGLLSKLTTIYPTTHPINDYKKVPIKFNL